MASKNFCDLCDEEIEGKYNPYFGVSINQQKQETYEEDAFTVDPEDRFKRIQMKVYNSMVCKNCTEKIRLLINKLTKKK